MEFTRRLRAWSPSRSERQEEDPPASRGWWRLPSPRPAALEAEGSRPWVPLGEQGAARGLAGELHQRTGG